MNGENIMKKTLFLFILCGWALTSNAQTTKQVMPISPSSVSVGKSIFSIQAGTIGIWVNNEARLSRSLVLRTEIGYSAQLLWGAGQEEGFLMTPVFTLEPRWYYNLQKRKSKSKSTVGNSGNYLSLQSGFYPAWAIFSTYDHPVINPVLAIIPMWGMHRSIGKHLNYEAGAGFGYVHYFADKYGNGVHNNLALNLVLRIGYRF